MGFRAAMHMPDDPYIKPLRRNCTLYPSVILQDGETTLHLASKQGHVAVVELLLAAGADVDAKSEVGGTTVLCWLSSAC